MSSLKTTSWAPSSLRNRNLSTKDFIVLDELDSSAFGKIFLVSLRGDQDDNTFILKKVFKASLSPANARRVRRECSIHSEVSHPFIVKLFAVIEDELEINLVMEHASEGDLFTLVSKVPGHKLPEEECCTLVIAPLLMALQFLHVKNVIHRDVKAENIFVTRDRVKLGDLGLAVSRADCGDRPVSRVGTLGLMAPEMLASLAARDEAPSSPGSPGSRGQGVPFNTALDIWAVGVLAFELLFGESPFPGRIAEEVLARIEEDSEFPEGLSEDGEDFIRCILVCDPADRPSARDLLKHPWVTSNTLASRLTKSLGTGNLSLPSSFPPSPFRGHHQSKSLEQVPIPELGNAPSSFKSVGDAIIEAGYKRAGLPAPDLGLGEDAVSTPPSRPAIQHLPVTGTPVQRAVAIGSLPLPAAIQSPVSGASPAPSRFTLVSNLSSEEEDNARRSSSGSEASGPPGALRSMGSVDEYFGFPLSRGPSHHELPNPKTVSGSGQHKASSSSSSAGNLASKPVPGPSRLGVPRPNPPAARGLQMPPTRVPPPPSADVLSQGMGGLRLGPIEKVEPAAHPARQGSLRSLLSPQGAQGPSPRTSAGGALPSPSPSPSGSAMRGRNLAPLDAGARKTPSPRGSSDFKNFSIPTVRAASPSRLSPVRYLPQRETSNPPPIAKSSSFKFSDPGGYRASASPSKKASASPPPPPRPTLPYPASNLGPRRDPSPSKYPKARASML